MLLTGDAMKRGEIFTVIIITLLIFLTVLLYVVVTGGNGAITDKWSLPTDNSTPDLRNIYISDDGTVFLIDGYHLIAMDKDGGLKWDISVPVDENLPGSNSLPRLESAASRDGYLYACLNLGNWSPDGCRGQLIAISPDGRVLWHKEYDETLFSTVVVSEDTVYLSRNNNREFSIFNLTSFDWGGNIKWSKDRVYLEPAIDESGNVYLIEGARIPIYSDSVHAYAPDGTMLWNQSLSSQGVNSPVAVIAHNGSLFVKTYCGIASMGSDGRVKWVKEYPGLSGNLVEFDTANNVYVTDLANLVVISPEGDYLASYGLNLGSSSYYPGSTRGSSVTYDYEFAIDDGIIYLCMEPEWSQKDSFKDLSCINLTAFSLQDHIMIWSSEIKPISIRTGTIEPDNAYALTWDSYDVDFIKKANSEKVSGYYDTEWYSSGMKASIFPGKDRIYVSYWINNYEVPPIYGKAKCAYAGGLSVFDKGGNLLWTKQTDSYIESLVEKNGTIYYSTSDGKFSATAYGVTAGLLAASFYLFLRFLVIGAVSRAKSRIEKNENRNDLLKFIDVNPGSTLYDITKGIPMNVGTVRYHLLILSINHRIKADHDDARAPRYFSCGRQYSTEEKLVISLMKRPPVVKLLRVLIEKPGLLNMAISTELGLPESAVSRYLRELADHGVVVKRRADSGKMSYLVDDKYYHIITSSLKR